MTKEDFEMTKKYTNDYTIHCNNHTCDESCPVWVVRLENKEKGVRKSCFRTFCQLKEEKVL